MCFFLHFKSVFIGFFSFVIPFIITFIILVNIFQSPQFSLIVGTYNYGRFLPELIDSVLQSTQKDFELIIVNDGSTDNTQEIIEDYAKKDKRIRFVIQENQGLSIARNNAMKIAKGEYLWFVDADDMIDKEALAKLKDKIYQLKPDMISFYIQRFNENKQNEEQSFYDLLDEQIKNFQDTLFTVDNLSMNTAMNYPVTSGKQIYRREFIQKNNIVFPPKTLFEDDVFFFHFFFSKAKATVIPDILYYKRSHSGAITADKSKYYDSTVRISMLIYDRLKSVNTPEEKARLMFEYYFSGVFGKWNFLSIEQKRKFYPVLVELSDWIAQKEKDDYWEKQQTILTEFMRKEQAVIFQSH